MSPTLRQASQGFVYIGLLTGLMILGIGLSAVSQVWTQASQRDREVELLFVGEQFRRAITRYYLESPPASRRFPTSIDELLEDRRTPGQVKRHLRKLYRDPITQTVRWGEVHLPGGQLVGVYSESLDRPLKSAEFSLRDKDFLDKSRYAEWVFRSPLPAANPVIGPNGGYVVPGAAVAPSSNNPARQPRPQTAAPPGVILPMPRAR
jgi:type II secretory pathway pseudopilin PulG